MEVEIVNQKSKILIGLMAVLIVALPLMSAIAAEDNDLEPIEPEGAERLRRFLVAHELQQQRQRRSIWFFKGAVKATLEDVTVVGISRNIVIVKDDEDYLNVIMPGRWYDESEAVLELEEMFLAIEGTTVNLEVLKRTVTNENEVSVTIYFCYEIDGYHAVLPYNIDGEE